MVSDNQYFLATNGIGIKNNCNEKDIAFIDDNFYSGIFKNITYPKSLSGEYLSDWFYGEKRDKVNWFYIAGGDDWFFEAKIIEFYGIYY